MPIPNKTGGAVQIERKQATPFNNDGTSKALFANQPNEPGWAHEGVITDDGEEARQCAAASHTVECVECGNRYDSRNIHSCKECGNPEHIKMRCTNIAVANYMTCKAHGGGFRQKPEVLRKAQMAVTKTGITVTHLMYCPCNAYKDKCQFAGKSEDGMCSIESHMYTSLSEYFAQEYKIEQAADLLMLNRLVMTMIRIQRGERNLAECGEIMERTRMSPDGTVENWFEPAAATKVVDSLDRRLQSWLKELAITKAAREGKMLTVKGTIDIANMLTHSKEETIEI